MVKEKEKEKAKAKAKEEVKVKVKTTTRIIAINPANCLTILPVKMIKERRITTMMRRKKITMAKACMDFITHLHMEKTTAKTLSMTPLIPS